MRLCMFPASTSGRTHDEPSVQTISFEPDEHSALQGAQATIWLYTSSSNLSVACKINWKMNCRVEASSQILLSSQVTDQLFSALLLSWICELEAFAFPGLLVSQDQSSGVQIHNSWKSSPLPSLRPQTIKRKNDSSVTGSNYFLWFTNGNNKHVLWGLPVGSVGAAQSAGNSCFPHCSKPKGTGALLPPV